MSILLVIMKNPMSIDFVILIIMRIVEYGNTKFLENSEINENEKS